MIAVPLQQFRQKLFVDGNVAGLERGQLGLVVVHQDYLMAEVGETRARHQSHVARTHHRNAHPIILRVQPGETQRQSDAIL